MYVMLVVRLGIKKRKKGHLDTVPTALLADCTHIVRTLGVVEHL